MQILHKKVLQDAFVLYSKVHSFHWNITGERFLELHTFFEEIYTNLWNTLDIIAEEIRMIGETSPKNISELSKNSSIEEETSIPTSEKMIEIIIADFESLINSAKDAKNANEEGIEGVLYNSVAEIKKHNGN